MTRFRRFTNYLLVVGFLLVVVNFGLSELRAEIPGEFRPKPVENPTEKVGATGMKIQPPDTFPQSRAPLISDPSQSDSLNSVGPLLRGSDLFLNTGWKLIQASRVTTADGHLLSLLNVDTRPWYNAIVPGTVLTTLVEMESTQILILA